MAADHFCLRWNNYQSNMVSELDILRTEEHLVDVTLSCDGQKFRAHKVILSACSPYFRNVFKENPCEHPVVILKDVSADDMEALLSFVYQGVVYVSEKNLSSFLQTAELLQIKGLTGAASNFNDDSSNKSISSSPQTPVKRRKSAPVRIIKHEEGEISNQMEADDEVVSDKRETSNDTFDEAKIEDDISEEEEPTDTDLAAELNASTFASVDLRDDQNANSESSFTNSLETGNSVTGDNIAVTSKGNISDNQTNNSGMATLLQQQLARARATAVISQPSQQLQNAGEQLSVQGQFQVPPPGQGLPDHISSSDVRGRTEWKCMQPQRCSICGKMFSNSGNLRQHISNVHLPSERVACTLCSRMFKNKEYLRKHHVQTHNAPLRRHRSN